MIQQHLLPAGLREPDFTPVIIQHGRQERKEPVTKKKRRSNKEMLLTPKEQKDLVVRNKSGMEINNRGRVMIKGWRKRGMKRCKK